MSDTKTVKTKVRKKPETIYILSDEFGEKFHGTFESYKLFSESDDSTELQMIERAKQAGLKLAKRVKRSRRDVTVVLYDPKKPPKIKFTRRKWGKLAGQKERSLEYTDSSGKMFRFWLQFDRDSREKFDKNAPQAHKHELEYHLLNLFVKGINGEEEQ